jgi:hypothetical protein
VDGTHIPVDIKSRNLNNQSKNEFISSKPKATTSGQNCLNFVVVLLANGFVIAVLFLLPAKQSNSQVIQVDQQLLTPTILTQPIKPCNEDFLPVQRAIADRLSEIRNKIELNFGYHKARFESQSGKKGLYKIPAFV